MSTFPAIILGSGSALGAPTTPRALISISAADLKHTHVIGTSGAGKSRWLASFFLSLMSHHVGAILIDPAGDLSRLLLKLLIATGYFTLPHAFDRLIYLDLPGALRQGRYLPFNVLDTGHDPYTTADLVLEAFKRAWPALKGGTATTIETLVKMSSFVLASHGLPLLPCMYYLLTNAAWREHLLRDIHDDLVLAFFRQYGSQNGKLPAGIEPTLKRIYLLAFAPVLRYSLGQRETVLNFRRILDDNRSVIINLNLPDLEAMRLLGCLVTVSAEVGAKARGAIPAERRHGTHMLFLDEFQNFTAQSEDALSHILEECRKYGLLLCLAHQNWSQIPLELRGAVQNCGIEVVFKLERPDAQESVERLGFPFDPFALKYRPTHPLRWSAPTYYSRVEQRDFYIDAITALAPREAFLKLPHGLYQMRALAVDDPPIDTATLIAVEQHYMARYFRSQATIEDDIAEMLASVTSDAEAARAAERRRPVHVSTPAATPFATMNGYDVQSDDDSDDEYHPDPL